MYICHPLKSADASGNESQSQKLEGPNTLGPQVLKSWRGLVPWVPYIHTYIQMCIAPPKIVRTTLRRHRVVVWLCLCLPLWQRLSSVCTTIYRPVGRKCKKVENGGVFFCKKVDLSSTQGALCTVSVFFILHFTYLGTHLPRLRAWLCVNK